MSVALGRGDGTFAAPLAFSTQHFYLLSVAVVDLNRDGHPDLVTATGDRPPSRSISNNVSVLFGRGDGTFAAAQAFVVGDVPTSIAVADLDGDGKSDLVVANLSSDVLVLLGKGNGTFAVPQTLPIDGIAHCVAVGDLNGDGHPDLVTANSTNEVSVLLGHGDGTFATEKTFAVAQGPVAVLVADLNGDGHPDTVTANIS